MRKEFKPEPEWSLPSPCHLLVHGVTGGVGWRLSVSGCRGPHLHPAQPCLLSARLWAVSRQPEVCQAAPQGGQAKTQLHMTEPPICHQTNLFLKWDFFFSAGGLFSEFPACPLPLSLSC